MASEWKDRRGLRVSVTPRNASRAARWDLIVLLQRIEALPPTFDPIEKMRLCEQAFRHPEFPITHSRNLDGRECTSIVEYLARCYPALLDSSAVSELQRWIYEHPGTIYFSTYLAERMQQDLDRTREVLAFITANPGITQFAARKLLDYTPSEMRRVLEFMDKLGTIVRTPTPKTNRLYPAARPETQITTTAGSKALVPLICAGALVRITCRVSKYYKVVGTVYEIQQHTRYAIVDMPKGTEHQLERILHNSILQGLRNRKIPPAVWPQGDPQWFPVEWLQPTYMEAR